MKIKTLQANLLSFAPEELIVYIKNKSNIKNTPVANLTFTANRKQNLNGMPNTEWQNVRKGMPCSVCDKTDWCSYSIDGKAVICRRVNNGKCITKKTKSGDDFYLYLTSIDNPLRFSRTNTAYLNMVKKNDKMPASISLCDSVYTLLFMTLTLDTKHEKDLIERGFTKEEIEVRGYKSIPQKGRTKIVRGMLNHFSSEQLLSVAGFYQKDEFISFAGKVGLAIPCRDINGNIFAIKIRVDESDDGGGRYRYLSSKFLNGTPAISSVHCPIRLNSDTSTIIITEGELKADFCCFKRQAYTIAVAGVSNLKGLIDCLKIINPQKVLIAFDNDMSSNEKVKIAFINIYQILIKEEFTVGVVKWN